MRRWIESIKKRRLGKLDILCVLVLIAGLMYMNTQMYRVDGLFQKDFQMVNGYIAKQDTQGNTYIVDKEHTRIFKLDSHKKVDFAINGNSRETDTISYVGDLAVSDTGDIFVEENHWGGLYVDREAILVYDNKGRYKATCYDMPYNDEYVDKRKIFGMNISGGQLYYVILQKDAIALYTMDTISYEHTLIETIDYENAYNAVYDVCIMPEVDSIYVLDKRNRVVLLQNGRVQEQTDGAQQQADDAQLQADGAQQQTGGVQVCYDSAEDTSMAGQAAFYNMAVDASQTIYLTDIKGNNIFRLDNQTQRLVPVLSGDTALTVNASVDSGGNPVLSAIYGGRYCEIDSSGKIFEADTFVRGTKLLTKTVVIYLFMALSVIAGAWLALRLIFLLVGLSLSQVTRNGILISGVVVVVTGIIVAQLMNSFEQVYSEEIFEKLSISAHSVSSQLDGGELNAVSRPEDFMGSEYNKLLDILEQILNRDFEFNQNIYCNILKYEDGQGYSVAYLDQSTGTYYPLDAIETEEVRQVYETGEDLKNGGKADVAGSFAYVKVPVFDASGNVTAVVAVGSDTSIIASQLAQMQSRVLITLVTIILVMLFLFGEILGFFDLRSKYKTAVTKDSNAVPLHMVRLIIFVTFLAFNMATSFLPVYAANLVSESIGIPKELAASLPVTLNLAFMGIMSLFCAPLMARFKFKTIAVVSACICLGGDLTIFLTSSYYTLILGLILNGIGVGLITNCINMFIASSKDMELKRDGFSIFNSGSISGINIGSMLGASLAGILDQQKVFAVSSCAWILVGILFILFGKYISQASRQVDAVTNKDKTAKMGFGRFIASPQVWGYMLFIQIPYIMLNSFIYYYVPLYGADQGFSENTTCLLLMVNSLCSVFFGVALTNFFTKRFREKTIYISTVMSLAALLLFAASPTVSVLIVTLLIMGISSSFGVSTKSVYFTELPKVVRYGAEESMGVYNLADNAGESVGPMIFGSLMSSGNLLAAMGKFVSVIFAAGAVYAVGSLRKGKGKR